MNLEAYKKYISKKHPFINFKRSIINISPTDVIIRIAIKPPLGTDCEDSGCYLDSEFLKSKTKEEAKSICEEHIRGQRYRYQFLNAEVIEKTVELVKELIESIYRQREVMKKLAYRSVARRIDAR